MPTIATYLPGYTVTVKPTSNIRSAPNTSATVLRTLSASETWAITGWVKGGVDAESGSDQWVCRWDNGRWEYTASANLTSGPTAPVSEPPPDITPFDQMDLDAKFAEGLAKGITDERTRITQRASDFVKSLLGL